MNLLIIFNDKNFWPNQDCDLGETLSLISKESKYMEMLAFSD